MAEEHRCQQAPEGHRLCTNNYGFFGSPTTMNLYSKCFRDIQSKEQEQAKTKSTIQSALYSATATTTVDSIPKSPVLNSPEIEASGLVSASVLSAVLGRASFDIGSSCKEEAH